MAIRKVSINQFNHLPKVDTSKPIISSCADKHYRPSKKTIASVTRTRHLEGAVDAAVNFDIIKSAKNIAKLIKLK